MSFLFDEIIFGPVNSRRLGISLGINILPRDKKFCTYNCIYCECGWTSASLGIASDYHSRADIRLALQHRLENLHSNHAAPDAITFAGNGEPTLHPEFPGVIDDTIELRNKYFPNTEVVVLSNSTSLGNPNVFTALAKVKNIMKLDAGSEKTFRQINGPLITTSLEEIVNNLMRFNGKVTIQTLFLKAFQNNKWVDNTTNEEVELWLGHLKCIMPESVMIYPIDRPAPNHNIEKIDPAILEQIASRVKEIGLNVNIYH